MNNDAAAAFLDREAAAAVVLGYASALDARDWARYRSLLTDEIAIDYGAIGSLISVIAADEWTARCRTLEGFDATAHRLHNIDCRIRYDAAMVTSIVDATHFVTSGDKVLMGDLIGHYTHHLRREDGWKISGVTLTVAGYPAGKAAFDNAFAIARVKFAERSQA